MFESGIVENLLYKLYLLFDLTCNYHLRKKKKNFPKNKKFIRKCK